MITVKTILFFILVAIPFLLHYTLRSSKMTKDKFINIFYCYNPSLSFIKKIVERFYIFLIMFYDKLKWSINARKFFTLIVFLAMIGIQFVTHLATNERVKYYQETFVETKINTDSKIKIVEKAKRLNIQAKNDPYLIPPFSFLLAALISFSFISFKIADKILNKLHKSNKCFILLGAAIIILYGLFNGKLSVVGDVLFVINIAAIFYPKWRGKGNPYKASPVPTDMPKRNIHTFYDAA